MSTRNGDYKPPFCKSRDVVVKPSPFQARASLTPSNEREDWAFNAEQQEDLALLLDQVYEVVENSILECAEVLSNASRTEIDHVLKRQSELEERIIVLVGKSIAMEIAPLTEAVQALHARLDREMGEAHDRMLSQIAASTNEAVATLTDLLKTLPTPEVYVNPEVSVNVPEAPPPVFKPIINVPTQEPSKRRTVKQIEYNPEDGRPSRIIEEESNEN
jgi:hypothetical protein